MHYNKLTPGIISSVFLLLIFSSINLSSVELVQASEDLVNYNNNFNLYTNSPYDPNKIKAMQNVDCVVNFMQSYIYTSSSASYCNQNNKDPQQGQIQSDSASDSPQTTLPQSSGIGIIRVVDLNSNVGSYTPVQSSSSSSSSPASEALTSNEENNVIKIQNDEHDDDDNDKKSKDKDNDDDDDNDKKSKDKDNDDDDDNDKKSKDKDNDDDDDNDKKSKDKDNDDDDDNDKKSKAIETKTYNENTVTKEQRKLLLTACFERGYDKGNYLTTDEIAKCAENYNTTV